MVRPLCNVVALLQDQSQYLTDLVPSTTQYRDHTLLCQGFLLFLAEIDKRIDKIGQKKVIVVGISSDHPRLSRKSLDKTRRNPYTYF